MALVQASNADYSQAFTANAQLDANFERNTNNNLESLMTINALLARTNVQVLVRRRTQSSAKKSYTVWAKALWRLCNGFWLHRTDGEASA